jgi:hypothetical protein
MQVELHSSEVFNSEGTTKEYPPSEAGNGLLEDVKSKTDRKSLETKSIGELKLLTNLLSNSMKGDQTSSKMRSIFSLSKSVPFHKPILQINLLPVETRTFWQRFSSYCGKLVCSFRTTRRRRQRRILQLWDNMHFTRPISPPPQEPISRRPVLYQIRGRIQEMRNRVCSRYVRVAPEIPDQNITGPN